MGRHVALEEVDLVFPEVLAGVGVEAEEALLLGIGFAGGVLQVEVVA